MRLVHVAAFPAGRRNSVVCVLSRDVTSDDESARSVQRECERECRVACAPAACGVHRGVAYLYVLSYQREVPSRLTSAFIHTELSVVQYVWDCGTVGGLSSD